MQSQFPPGRNQRAPTPTPSCSFTDISTQSSFSNVSVLSASSVASQRIVPPEEAGFSFFRRFRGTSGLRKCKLNIIPNCDPNPQLPSCSNQYSGGSPGFKNRNPRLPAPRPTPQSGENTKEIPSLLSMPPLVSSFLPVPPKNNPPPIERNPPPNERNPPKGRTGLIKKCNGIQLAVLNSCPGSRLTEEQVAYIQNALVEELDSIGDVKAQPRFLNSFFDQGVLWMTCANLRTKQWLLETVWQLNKFLNGFNLKVVNARIPRRPIVSFNVVDLENPLKVLQRLNHQNPRLNTSRWVILNRKVFQTLQRLTCSIDLDSLDFLKASRFRVSWKLTSVTFKIQKPWDRHVPVRSCKRLPHQRFQGKFPRLNTLNNNRNHKYSAAPRAGSQ